MLTNLIDLVLESPGNLLMVRENDTYCLCSVTVVYFFWQNDNKHSVHVKRKWWWKGVGVGEEEPTRNYIKLVLAPEMGQGIMQNTVRESRGISFLKLSGTLLRAMVEKGLPVGDHGERGLDWSNFGTIGSLNDFTFTVWDWSLQSIGNDIIRVPTCPGKSLINFSKISGTWKVPESEICTG